jgi:hypothetical protein
MLHQNLKQLLLYVTANTLKSRYNTNDWIISYLELLKQ